MKQRASLSVAVPVACLALLLNGCATPPRDAAEALRPYYATLTGALPVAPPGPPLDPAATLTRIAFGSCDQQDRPQTIWNSIQASKPDLFLAIGDNVYGDTGHVGDAGIPTLTAAYEKLAAAPEFTSFRARVPMMATWDDHDFGQNDAGASFAFKERAESIYEAFWGSSPAVRARPGVHDGIVVGPDGRRVQIILLDTRFFRGALKSLPYSETPRPLGNYVPTDDPAAAVLGDAQWAWLAAELDKSADVRLIVSSIQLVTDAHGYEKWGNFPAERARFYRLLADKRIANAVVLSGDRHQAAIYRHAPQETGRPLHEITASSLNFSFARPGESKPEPDPLRLDGMFPQENFGIVDIDWGRGAVWLRLLDNDGAMIAERRVDIAGV